MRPTSAPSPCGGCAQLTRTVMDINTRGLLYIDAVAAAGDAGNVRVVQIEPSQGMWLVEVYERPGPPEPAEQWLLNVPPPMFTVHVCPEVPQTWPGARADEARELVTP